MSCGKRPLNRDGSRPQWHKDDFPWMEDEAYNRPVTPDEFIQKRDAYMKEKSKQADQKIWWIVALILLFSIRWENVFRMLGGN